MNREAPWKPSKGLQLAVGLIVSLLIFAGCVLSLRDPGVGLHRKPTDVISAFQETAQARLTRLPDPPLLPTRIASPTPSRMSPATALISTAIPSPTPITLSSNAVAFVADGQRLSPPRGDSLWVANLDGSGERELLDNLKPIYRSLVAWSPDQEWLAVSDLSGLKVLPVNDDASAQVLTEPEGQIWGLAWAPDSRRLAFIEAIDSERGRLVIRDRQDSSVIYRGISVGSELRWSPDGQKLAFVDHMVSLAVLDLRDNTVIRIDEQSACGGTVQQLAWSPDGRRLASWRYGNGRYGHGSVCVYDSSSQQQSLIYVPSSHSTNFAWDPGGRLLYLIVTTLHPDVFETPDLELNPRLLLFSVEDGLLTELVSLTEQPDIGAVSSIDVSPDGKWLSMFFPPQDRYDRNGTFEIRSLDGTKTLRWPVDLTIFDNTYAWAGDSRHLLFVSVALRRSGVFGAIYALDISTGGLTKLTEGHWIKSWAAAR